MLKIILGCLAVIIVVLIVIIMMKPDDFRYTRTATINAPVETVFPYFNNTKKANEWSPWISLDPNAKITFEGPTEGVGAKFSWVGNKNMGEGSMAITESKPNELVRSDLTFIKPMAGISTVDYTFVAKGEQTEVTWAMYGPNSFMGKAMSLFFDCEKMVGDKTDEGFANLNKLLAKST